MSTSTPEPSNAANEQSPSLAQAARHELAELQQHWWAFLILGIGLVLLGTIALSCTPFVSVVTVALFGIIMLVGGIAQVVSAFWAGKWSGFMLQILLGILYVIVGYILMDKPLEGCRHARAGHRRLSDGRRPDSHRGFHVRAISRLGLVAVERDRHVAAWIADLPWLAHVRSDGDRFVRRHRDDLQWLVLDHALLGLKKAPVVEEG